MRPIFRLAFLSLLCFLCASACGGAPARTDDAVATGNNGPTQHVAPNASVPRAHAHGDHQATANVGTLGGTLELGNGATLEIPAGALAQTVEVVFGLATQTNAFNNHFDEEEVGPTLMVAPELVSANGAKFVVTLPHGSLPDGYSPGDASVALEDEDTSSRGFEGGAVRTRWDHENARSDGHAIRTELARMPGMRIQFLVGR